jgi:hypothetical protein
MAKKVRYTQPLLGVPANNALGYLVLVPGASVLIRQNGVACTVYSSNAGAAMTNPVPTGVSPGTAGVDTRGTLVVYLEPGSGYDGVATVGNVASTFPIPDISPDVSDVQGPIAPGTYVDTTTDQVKAGKLTVGALASANQYRVELNGPAMAPAGSKGIVLDRGAAGGALGLNLLTNGVMDWNIGLDFNLDDDADLVLAYDASLQADVLRVRKGGPFLAIANTAMPQDTQRVRIASNGVEGGTLRELLRFEIGDAASPITHILRFVGQGGQFGVTKAGNVGAGIDTPTARFHAVVSNGPQDVLRMNLNGAADTGFIAWTQGSGVTDWRLGRDAVTSDLVFYNPYGAVGSPGSPGQAYLRLVLSGGVQVHKNIGLNGSAPVAKGTVTGSRGGNAALASLLTYLASRGDITDSSTA